MRSETALLDACRALLAAAGVSATTHRDALRGRVIGVKGEDLLRLRDAVDLAVTDVPLPYDVLRKPSKVPGDSVMLVIKSGTLQGEVRARLRRGPRATIVLHHRGGTAVLPDIPTDVAEATEAAGEEGIVLIEVDPAGEHPPVAHAVLAEQGCEEEGVSA